MKNESNNGITRRSFIKRSTVAAIAASNLMMFTGLVNAVEESPSPMVGGGECVIDKFATNLFYAINNRVENVPVYICTATGCDKKKPCGQHFLYDANNIIATYPDGSPVLTDVFVQCIPDGNQTPPTTVCIRPVQLL
jgi:hypothetical protein